MIQIYRYRPKASFWQYRLVQYYCYVTLIIKQIYGYAKLVWGYRLGILLRHFVNYDTKLALDLYELHVPMSKLVYRRLDYRHICLLLRDFSALFVGLKKYFPVLN